MKKYEICVCCTRLANILKKHCGVDDDNILLRCKTNFMGVSSKNETREFHIQKNEIRTGIGEIIKMEPPRSMKDLNNFVEGVIVSNIGGVDLLKNIDDWEFDEQAGEIVSFRDVVVNDRHLPDFYISCSEITAALDEVTHLIIFDEKRAGKHYNKAELLRNDAIDATFNKQTMDAVEIIRIRNKNLCQKLRDLKLVEEDSARYGEVTLLLNDDCLEIATEKKFKSVATVQKDQTKELKYFTQLLDNQKACYSVKDLAIEQIDQINSLLEEEFSKSSGCHMVLVFGETNLANVIIKERFFIREPKLMKMAADYYSTMEEEITYQMFQDFVQANTLQLNNYLKENLEYGIKNGIKEILCWKKDYTNLLTAQRGAIFSWNPNIYSSFDHEHRKYKNMDFLHICRNLKYPDTNKLSSYQIADEQIHFCSITLKDLSMLADILKRKLKFSESLHRLYVWSNSGEQIGYTNRERIKRFTFTNIPFISIQIDKSDNISICVESESKRWSMEPPTSSEDFIPKLAELLGIDEDDKDFQKAFASTINDYDIRWEYGVYQGNNIDVGKVQRFKNCALNHLTKQMKEKMIQHNQNPITVSNAVDYMGVEQKDWYTRSEFNKKLIDFAWSLNSQELIQAVAKLYDIEPNAVRKNVEFYRFMNCRKLKVLHYSYGNEYNRFHLVSNDWEKMKEDYILVNKDNSTHIKGTQLKFPNVVLPDKSARAYEKYNSSVYMDLY